MKKWKLLFVILFAAAHAQACTTCLFTHNGHHYFGRNYEWITGNGALIVNPRSLQKQSLETKTGKQTEWISRYGSITFNQYGREFPTGGMNEEGLVVELMWLDETRYPAADDRPAMQVLQWIQY